MSVVQIRQTTEAFLEALSSRGNYGRFFADGISFDVLWSATSAQGPREVEATIRAIHEVAFDARSEVLRLVVGENGAAAELSFAGRHTGEFRGVEPTGRLVRVAYSAFFDVADGRIDALRIYLPVERLLGQIRGRTVDLEELFPEMIGGDVLWDPDRASDPQPHRDVAADSERGPDRGSLWQALRSALRRSDREGSRTSRDAVH